MRNNHVLRRTERAGFSLLEVLAAVALLGIVFTALSRSASMGVISEGNSRTLMAASLVADSALAELELAAQSGQVPSPGVSKYELDEFTISIETVAFALPEALRAVRDQLFSTPSEVFGDGTDNDPGAVREILLTVSWPDGSAERSVERVTYAVDYSAISGFAGEGAPSLQDMNRIIDEAGEAP